MCVLLIHTFWYIDMPDVRASYGIPFDFIKFFGHFHTLLLTIHVWIVVSPPNFHWLYILSILIYDMPDVTASYGMPFKFITFFENLAQNWGIFMSELLYLHQSFIDCVSNQYWYVKISDVIASYGMPFNFFYVFCEFCTKLMNMHLWSVAYPPNFYGFSV